MTATSYATLAQVKQRLAGDTPAMSGEWDDVLTALIAEISAMIDREVAAARGVLGSWSFVADSTATARRYSRRYSSPFLPIDDCVTITAVSDDGTALVADTDYVVTPLQGTPIIGLERISGAWSPGRAGLVTVTAKWGWGTAAPTDVREVTITEVIRSYNGARAGMDDRIGITPFGKVITARAFTDKSRAMIATYGHGGGFLR